MSSLTTDVFTLEQLYFYQLDKIFNSGFKYGYFAAGIDVNTGGYSSSVVRLDYANDTQIASQKSNLSVARQSPGGTGNRNFGWFMNGYSSPGYRTTLDRLNYDNDTVTALSRGNSGHFRYIPAASGNTDFGWYYGGTFSAYTPSTGSTVERVVYASDLLNATTRGGLVVGKSSHSAVGTKNYGWIGAGIETPGPYSALVSRFDYANDTATSSPRGPLGIVRYGHASTGNADYGWFGGGYSTTTNTYHTMTERIDYVNDTATASPRGTIVNGRYFTGATGNSNSGWWVGGTPNSTTVDRINFSNDTVQASFRGSLAVGKYYLTATSPLANNVFPGITLQQIIPNQQFGYAYFAGGYSPGSAPSGFMSMVSRFDYNNDTSTVAIRGPLSFARNLVAGASSRDYAYFAGGSNPAGTTTVLTTVDRIDYLSDTQITSVRGSLSMARYSLSSTCTSSYGWFIGGIDPSTYVSRIDRIDYSNDTATASIRTGLIAARGYHGSTGNTTYAWFGGGQTPTVISTVERMQYSNDTAVLSPRGPLWVTRSQHAATGNADYGWFGGGINPGATPTLVSTVDRITYVNDLIQASPRGNLSYARERLSATGNISYGWFAGGYVPSPAVHHTRIDRIDYSNDTAAASPRGTLSNIGRRGMGATSCTSNALPQS